MHAAIRKPVAAALLLLPLAAATLLPHAAHAQTPHWTPNIPAQVPGLHSDRDVAPNHGERDHRAPRIHAQAPADGARIEDHGRTQLAARLADTGSGIDARSVRLRVDGRDVTRQARVRPHEVRYAAALSPGRHVAERVVRDHAGNASRSGWSFDVVRHAHRG